MKTTLGRYKIGIGILGVFTLVLVVFVLIQAAATKQDANTDTAANKVADKLSSYIDKNQTIPSSLAAAGATNVPSAVSYTKLSDSSYKFCVTYKNNSSGFDASEVTDELTSGSTVSNDTSDSSGDSSYLYVPTTHHKGQNCQTITPYLYSPTISSPCDGSTLPISCQVDDSGSNGSGDGSGLSGTGSADSSAAAKSIDVQQETDINMLQTQLEAYYADNGYYPTLANINSATWRTQNMPSLDSSALEDPQGSSAELVAAPTQYSYSYQATGDSNSSRACDNGTAGDCTHYVLTAELESGGIYTKDSLN